MEHLVGAAVARVLAGALVVLSQSQEPLRARAVVSSERTFRYSSVSRAEKSGRAGQGLQQTCRIRIHTREGVVTSPSRQLAA